MPRSLRYTIITLMLIVGVVAMYVILNAGNPDSVIRPLVPNPGHDVYVAMGASIFVFVLGFFIFLDRDQDNFRHFIRLNFEKIRQSRNAGRTDAQIADEILARLGSVSGYRHNLTRKKLIFHLSKTADLPTHDARPETHREKTRE